MTRGCGWIAAPPGGPSWQRRRGAHPRRVVRPPCARARRPAVRTRPGPGARSPRARSGSQSFDRSTPGQPAPCARSNVALPASAGRTAGPEHAIRSRAEVGVQVEDAGADGRFVLPGRHRELSRQAALRAPVRAPARRFRSRPRTRRAMPPPRPARCMREGRTASDARSGLPQRRRVEAVSSATRPSPIIAAHSTGCRATPVPDRKTSRTMTR